MSAISSSILKSDLSSSFSKIKYEFYFVVRQNICSFLTSCITSCTQQIDTIIHKQHNSCVQL